MRDLTPLSAALLLLAACSTEQAERFEPLCSVTSFRACKSEECSGVQQCFEPGSWGPCECVVTDASYADVPLDALSDAPADADAALDASEAAADADHDAGDGGDAAADAGVSDGA